MTKPCEADWQHLGCGLDIDVRPYLQGDPGRWPIRPWTRTAKSVMRPPGADKDVPSTTHSFDAGAASGYFALQALQMGWHVHGMAGFDRDRAFAELGVPIGHRVEAAYAVGRRGEAATLPPMLRDREYPSQRLPLAQLAFEGGFGS